MMKLCNEVITVLNEKKDGDYGVYYPTVIAGASWFCKIAVSVEEYGVKFADLFTVRIPADADFGGKTYVDPIQYKALEEVSGVFTLQPKDIIVRGIVTGDSHTFEDIKEQFVEAFTILSVTDNRRARAKHWKVAGR